MMSKENTKSLGGSWVESLYHKFEAVCQEVDDIVNHDHMKALENSVQLVGGNVIKLYSNVKDLIPSNAVASLKDVEKSAVLVESNSGVEEGNGECSSVGAITTQSSQQIDVEQAAILVESNSKVEEGDEECSPVSVTEQFSQQQIDVEHPVIHVESNSEAEEEFSLTIDFTDSSKVWPSCSKVSDDVDSVENPSFKDPCSSSSGLQLGQTESLSICQDRCVVSEEWVQASEISDPRFTDSFLIDLNFHSFTEEKQRISDESELTYHESSMINENIDLVSKKEEPLSDAPELTSPDEDPCESSMFCNQNDKLEDKVAIDISSAASIHSSGSGIHKKEEPLQENIDDQSSELDSRCIDGIVNNKVHENSPVSQVYVKEMISDINHKLSQESEVQVEEENSPCSSMASSTTVTYPLLHFSDNNETKSESTEWHSFDCDDTEIGSVFTSASASQTSEPYTCLISPMDSVGAEDSCLFPFTSQEFTEVPINSPGESEGFELKHMEVPGKSELDGSCVFVQNDRNHIDLSAVGRRWTYKKKMRNPFTSRKKLEKEYKQLSIWYCDIDAEFNKGAGDKLVPSSHNNKHKHPSAQDLQDSEWEFV